MKFLIIFAFSVAVAAAKPLEQNVAVTQDTLGNYKFAVNTHGHSRLEQRNADGTVSGSYTYTDAKGVVQTIHYTAGPGGFRAFGDNLPVPPVDHNVPIGDTEDVARVRAMHLAVLQQGLPRTIV